MNDSIQFAFAVIGEHGWTHPWLVDDSPGCCIHDALLGAGSFDDYVRAVNVLSQVIGEDVMMWEREPGRTEEDVIELLEKVLV